MNNFDESKIWTEVRLGDPAAFTAIFDLHRDRVYGQALRVMRSVHDAEDVTALVFLEAWRRRLAVRVVEGSIIGWLLVTTNYVARNFARTQRRYNKAMAALPLVDGFVRDDLEEIDDRLDAYARSSTLTRAFARLPQNDQDVITLCVLEDFSINEAARALGIPVGTVKSRLSRAKRKISALTAQFDQQNVVEGGVL